MTHRPDAPNSAKPRTLVPPPLPYVLAVGAGWWLDRKVVALPLAWSVGGVDPGALHRWLGGAFIAAGVALLVWTLLTFRRHRTTVNPYAAASALCTRGPFAFSRNPIYVGDWLLLIGAAIWIHSAWPLLFAPLIWAIVHYGVIRHEEAHLAARFGDAYHAYCRRVRRWL